MDLFGHMLTRYDTEAIDRDMDQTICQTFTETGSNKDQHHE